MMVERVVTLHVPFWTASDDKMTSPLKRFGAHTRNELATLLSFVRSVDVVLDVGGRIGTLFHTAGTTRRCTSLYRGPFSETWDITSSVTADVETLPMTRFRSTGWIRWRVVAVFLTC